VRVACTSVSQTVSHMLKNRARALSAQMTLPPTPHTLLNVWGPIQNVGASYILYVAARTCMVRAVLHSTVLRAFSHFHAIYRCFPYNSARNSYFPLHLCAGPVGDSGAQINQPTGARVQTSTSVGALAYRYIYSQNRGKGDKHLKMVLIGIYFVRMYHV